MRAGYGTGDRPVLPRAVLEAVRSGQTDALGTFFDAYFDRVYGFISQRVRDRSQAEDLAQEVFYKVQRAAHQLDPARDPLPWLLAVAHNACRDYWRSVGHRLTRASTSIDEHSGLEHALPAHDDAAQELLAGERARLVREAIERLPEMLRTAILLRDYEGLDHEEIAQVLGIGYAAARKRYSRALESLGRMLRESLG